MAQSIPPQQNSINFEEDMGYRTMTREDAAILQSQQISTVDGRSVASPQTPTTQNQQNVLHSPSTPQGHHRTSSAPSAPQPPPMAILMQNVPQQTSSLSQQTQMIGVGTINTSTNIPPIYQTQQSYSSQSSQNSYGSNQNITQYNNQPIYVSSNSSQSLNQQLQQQISHNNGAIYVAPSIVSGGLPTSASNNSVGVYGQQPVPPPSSSPGGFGQTNGNSTYSSPQQFIPQPPQMPQISQAPQNSIVPPQAPPPPPMFGAVFNATPSLPQIPLPSVTSTGNNNQQSDGVAPPPPPPPPVGGLSSTKSDGLDMNSLAAQLKQAQLKRNQKTTPAPAENSGSSTSSGGSGNYGTIGRSTSGMASMMDEMAKTLARRRAQVEKKEPDPPNDDMQNTRQRPWEKSNTLPHKLGSGNSITANNQITSSQGPISNTQINGDVLSIPLQADLDSFKAEIIREMRIEITKAKQEIIDAIKSEFNRR
jgi:hypothetical protein